MATPLLTALLATASAATPCAEGRTTGDVVDALGRAEAGYAALDAPAFEQAVDDARSALECLTEPVPRHLAASLHRFEGLRAFVAQDPARSMAAFAAARAIEPAWIFPESLVPAGNPVLDDYNALDPAAGAVEEVPAPAAGQIRFDGAASRRRPRSHPTVLQLFADDGAVELTRYLWGDDPLPAYPVAAGPSGTGAAVPAEAAPSRRGPRAPLLVATGASGAAALSLWGASWLSRDAWADTTDRSRVDPLRRQTNGLVVGSGVAATSTLVLGIVTYATARR